MKLLFSSLSSRLGICALAVFLSCSAFIGLRATPAPDGEQCDYEATFVLVRCGTSAYGDHWIRLSDGTLLRPCETNYPHVDTKELLGKTIKVSYTRNVSSCPMETTCPIAIPAHIDAKITCLVY